MEGFSNQLKNIRLHDVQLFMEPEQAIDKRSRNGFLFDGVEKLSLTDCEVHWNEINPEKTWESAFMFKNVNNLKLIRTYGVKAPLSKFPAFRYENTLQPQIVE